MVTGRCCRLSLAFSDECHEVRLESGAVFCRMPQQELDQPSFACPKMPVHPSTCETMQQGDWLPDEKLFKFFGCHGNSSNTPRRRIAIACDAVSAKAGCVSLSVWSCERNSKVRASKR